MKNKFFSKLSKNKKETGFLGTNFKIMTEEQLQQQIIIWFNNNYCLKTNNPRCIIFSVPNDSSNFMETKRKVNTGLLKGVSDLIVILPFGKLLFVELKTEKGIQSEVQKDFQKRIEKLGQNYYLIRSLNEFKLLIQTHHQQNY